MSPFQAALETNLLLYDARAAVKEMQAELASMAIDDPGRDLLAQQIADLQQCIENSRAALREAPLE